MTWREDLDGLALAVVDEDEGFGEPMVIPGGTEIKVAFGEPTEDGEIRPLGTDSLGRLVAYLKDPWIACLDADAASLTRGMPVTVHGKAMTIASDPQSDGGGLTVFTLAYAQKTTPTGETTWR